jgi:ABC-2 type transport system ATP-binding protein
MIALEQVAKRYGRGGPVVSGFDLELADGQIVVLAGANGSGKSTVLRMVAGLTKPSGGKISGLSSTVSYLPESFPSELRVSAAEYLHAMAAIRRVKVARAEDVLAELRFTGDRTAPMSTLSKGNAQKVGLAQAFLAESGPMVLDEPWSGLDRLASDRLGPLLVAEAKRDRVVLLTDHGGFAHRLEGVRALRLLDGELVPDEATGAAMLVELRCPPGVRGKIKTMLGVQSSQSDDSILSVRVAQEQCDRLLMAVLSAGCSVVAVHPAGTTVRRP